jgi:hypothetical protein
MINDKLRNAIFIELEKIVLNDYDLPIVNTLKIKL